jgi:hypothetical protein
MTPNPSRYQRKAAGLQATLAYLTSEQALTVSAWEAENLAAADKIIPAPRGYPKGKPRFNRQTEGDGGAK